MTCAALGLITIGCYLAAVRLYRRRYPRRDFSGGRIAAFVSGVVIGVCALLPPVNAWADRSFTVHMLQHLALTMVVPPLILLGAPLLLLLALSPSHIGRKITQLLHHWVFRALTSPVVSWFTFVAVLWGVHLSPIYNLALRNEAVHVLEHCALFTAAMLFWMAVVQVGYAPRPLPFAARLFYLFWAIPQGAFLGLTIYSARHVLYGHYLAGRSVEAALLDQRYAGAVMWIGGGALMFVAFMSTAAVWAASEREEAGA